VERNEDERDVVRTRESDANYGPENKSGRRLEKGRASNLFQRRDENSSGEWKWQ
jgi:hypothetical protein